MPKGQRKNWVQELEERATEYDLMEEISRMLCNMTLNQLASGDAVEARIQLHKILRVVKREVRTNGVITVSEMLESYAPSTHQIVTEWITGRKWSALFESGDVPNINSRGLAK